MTARPTRAKRAPKPQADAEVIPIPQEQTHRLDLTGGEVQTVYELLTNTVIRTVAGKVFAAQAQQKIEQLIAEAQRETNGNA